MTAAEPQDELMKACPYRGLVPYFEDDAEFFFGRESDTRIIVANCLTTRVTLFYGASGVGKSSVLYAGVIRELRRRALANLDRRNCPECAGVAFSSWRDDPVKGLIERVDATLRKLLPESWLEKMPPPAATLAESLRAWTEFMKSDLVLLLDQFEEYFLYRDTHDTSFADELVAVVNDPEIRVNVLISIREDALARLDTFKANIPSLFANGLRLDHLTTESARLAIERPLKLYNARLPAAAARVSIEPALVDELLSQVQAGRVRLKQAGTGAVRFGSGVIDAKARVEAPYLQMVMMRLWREDIARGGTALQLGTLKKLGGAEKILRTHLDVVMAQLTPAEQTLAARVFHQLVTPGGTKIAHYVNDLAEFAHAPEPRVAQMCLRLEDWQARVLRDVTPPGMDSKRYEIFHDLLAAPILDWRQRRVAEEQRLAARKTWALRIAAVFAVGGLMAASVIGWLWVQKTTADKQAKQAVKAKDDAVEVRNRVVDDSKVLLQRLKTQGQQALSHQPAPSSSEQLKLSQEAAQRERTRFETGKETGRPSVANGGDSPLSNLPAARVEGAVEFATQKINTSQERDVWNADYASFPVPAPPGTRPTFLITAGRDKTAFAMDLVGDNDFFLIGHQGEVNAALINPNAAARATGWFAATASDDTTARVWKFGTGAAFAELKKHTAALTGLAWSRDGRWLVTTGKDRKAIIWDVGGEQPRAVRILEQSAGSVWQAALLETAAASWMVTACGDGKAYLYSFPDGKFLHAFDHGALVRRAVLSPDGRYVLTAGGDGRAVLWDRASGDPLLEAVHEKAVRDVAFDASGQHFVTGSADGTAQVWDVQTRKGIVALKGHTAPVFAVAFTPGGPGVVTASWDRTARLWNFEEKRCLALCTGHTDVIWSLKFSPSGTNFCTTGADGTTRLWDLKAIPGTEALRPK